MERRTMTLKELQEYLGISYTTAYKLVVEKGFPSFRIGKRILIDRDGLCKWIKEKVDAK